MKSHRMSALWPLLCLAVFAMRMADVHVHLCLDGQEAPQSLHWADAGVHEDDEHLDNSHADVELALLDDALVKTSSPGFDLPVLMVAGMIVLLLLAAIRQPAPARFSSPPRRSPRFLRPLLRGPPL